MSNIYEQMLLTDKTGLVSKIKKLIREILKENAMAWVELNHIAEFVRFDVEIEEVCYFKGKDKLVCGSKVFDFNSYHAKDYYSSAREAFNDDVRWDYPLEYIDYDGTFYWSGSPEVGIYVNGVTDNNSRLKVNYGNLRF